MSTFNQQPRSLALEEPSEGRTTAKAFRDAARNQSPQNPLRQSTTSTGNPFNASPPQARGSANGELTVDSLLEKVQGLLNQTQSPKPQGSFQARQPGLGYSQPMPLNQVPSPNMTATPPNGRQSITSAKKNEIFVKKSYDNPLWNSEPLVINSVKESQTPKSMTPKSMARNTELFPIKESLNASTVSTAPRNSEKAKKSALPTDMNQNINLAPNVNNNPNNNSNIHNTMDDLYSRLNNLEKQLNSIGTSNLNNPPPAYNNEAYTTPRSQSIPPSKTGSLFTTPVQQQQESQKKSSPYAARDRPSSSMERPNIYTETNPKLDAEISEKICQTIDKLIETHLTQNRSPGRSPVLSQRNFYTSPSKQLYDPTTTNPLYKSSVLAPTEPVYKSTPYSYQSTNEPSPTYNSPKYEPRPAYDPLYGYEPYDSRSPLPKYESRPTYEPVSKYEPYEPRSYDPLPASKYESQYNYEPRPAYEPLPSYESRPYESRYTRDYEPINSYEPRYNYEKDYRAPYANTSSYSYLPDYEDSQSRSRPRYIRPLLRKSPPRYATESNWSTSNLDHYLSPHSDDYYNRNIYSVTGTPIKENPHPHDVNSTDKKLKKLTLKSKVSEEREGNEPRHTPGKKDLRPSYKAGELLSDHDYSDALPLPSVERALTTKKTQKKVKATPVPEEPVNCDECNVKASKYRASDLQNDDSFNAGELLMDSTPRHRAGDLVQDSDASVCDWKEKDCDLEEDRDEEIEHARERARREEREGERERVRKQEKLRQSQRIANNVADDGKAWNMVHRLPSSVFEEEASGFDFNQPEPRKEANKKQPVRNNQQARPKQTAQPSSKAMVWTMDESVDVSRRGSLSNLSDSIRRSQRKPVITHCFEKSDRLGY